MQGLNFLWHCLISLCLDGVITERIGKCYVNIKFIFLTKWGNGKLNGSWHLSLFCILQDYLQIWWFKDGSKTLCCIQTLHFMKNSRSGKCTDMLYCKLCEDQCGDFLIWCILGFFPSEYTETDWVQVFTRRKVYGDTAQPKQMSVLPI
jgi:hypothetical protein